jgi:arylsulfatase A-like enzyme
MAVVAAACRREPEPPVADNVVVILLDALRADRLSAYGNPRQTSPNIDAIAAAGTRFDTALTTAPWTLPAMGSLWTSQYPSVHGAVRRSNEQQWVTDRARFRPVNALADAHTTLPEVLRANGFATGAFVDGAYPGAAFGFGQGFEVFSEDEDYGVRLNAEALVAWIDAQRPRRFFAYLHIVETHSPYTPPGPPLEYRGRTDPAAQRAQTVLEEERARMRAIDFDPGYAGPLTGSLESMRALRGGAATPADVEHLKALYDRGIAYSDHWIGWLLDELARRGLAENTAIIVTADHGEELLERGATEHGDSLFEEIMRIPLIIRAPRLGGGRVAPAPVSLIDIMPTVLDLTGVPTTAPMQGISLVPALRGQALPQRTLFAEADFSGQLVALRDGPHKFTTRGRPGSRALFDLAGDAGETRNLCKSSDCGTYASAVRAWQREMKGQRDRLAAPAAPAAPTAVLDERAQERLRALGYEE